jgi:peptidoglycan/xylan/chitin deacetylase (PgdA/CDA1 family)
MAWLIWSLEVAGKFAAAWLAWRGRGTWPVAAAFFAPDILVFYHLFVPSAQGFCRVATRFETSGREVWLTIDDGPDAADTPKILELLERHDARATFFTIGERAEERPALVEEIERRWKQVGHHTQTHPV